MADVINMNAVIGKRIRYNRRGSKVNEEMALKVLDLIAPHLLANSAAAKDSIAAIESGKEFLKEIIVKAGTIMFDAGVGDKMELTTAASDLFGEPIDVIADVLYTEEEIMFFYGIDGYTEYTISAIGLDKEEDGEDPDDDIKITYAVILFKSNAKENVHEIFTDGGWKPYGRSEVTDPE